MEQELVEIGHILQTERPKVNFFSPVNKKIYDWKGIGVHGFETPVEILMKNNLKILAIGYYWNEKELNHEMRIFEHWGSLDHLF